MTKNEFLSRLQDMLQTDEQMAPDTDLKLMEEWDSLAFMVLITFFAKNFGLRITFNDLEQCRTPADIMRLGGRMIG